MVKQRFRVLFRTLVLHCGESLRTNFGVRAVGVGPAVLSVCAPLGLLDLLMGALLVFLLTALLCWLRERVDMVQAALVAGFVSELRQCSRSYWKPEAVRINKA